MNDQVVELLKDKIDKVDQKVDRIEEKVTEMLAFKWQIVGGSVVISVIIGLIVQIALTYITKGA